MFSKIQSAWRKLATGAAAIEPPLAIESLDSQHWDKTVDVAVIGFGGAGAAAAIEARDQGAEVAVIDRFNGGGSTRISGGIYYAGGGTGIQQQAGVEDSPDNMFRYLRHETGGAVSADTLRRFCDDSPRNLYWLMQQGVPFDASLCPFKTSYPSNSYYLYYSGNEAFAPYSEDASPAPRGHRAHGKGVSGAVFFGPLATAARARGIHIMTQHRATGLVTDSDGRAVGVRLRRFATGSLAGWLHRHLYSLLIFGRYGAMYLPAITVVLRAMLEKLEVRYGKEFFLRARRGIVISTGGFFYNRDMVAQYAPEHLPGMPLGTIGDDGSGILLGTSVNAATTRMGNVSQWRFINPPESFVRGVLVDSQGRRFCNEMYYGAQLNQQIMEKAGGEAWLILDKSLAKRALRQIGPRRAMWFQAASALLYLFIARKRASTLEELAGKLGMPAETLAQTVQEYNALSHEGTADPLGKPADHLAVLQRGPWYALDCRVAGAVRNPSITLGGLRVDESTGAVLDDNAEAIAGLYAAGRAAEGVASASYVSGLSLADCIFTGRRAGRHAAGQPAD
ncbi:FAD-binding protein [Pseudohalioglobus sediminis]|uniref:FAD-binding protein n=1 Tax=Pseudohalioglobus sediminis TaxID=2606449 RepID=A0A5B0X6V2_9GAMM|nr:FAD-binding protein [Pseudohalioglobus sediminis]KAA1194197.1 FAD-binding protein [Pseudohalioglobus sediminis]